MSTTEDARQKWVQAYCANLRHLGAQMGNAVRRLEASWLDALNRSAEKQEEA